MRKGGERVAVPADGDGAFFAAERDRTDDTMPMPPFASRSRRS
jgi:hypothetical protein